MAQAASFEFPSEPISPDDAIILKESVIPPVVFQVFNELIAQNIARGKAVVYQKDIVALLKEKGVNMQQAYAKHWLDVESCYQSKGWKVKYSSPCYDESFDAYFEFSVK